MPIHESVQYQLTEEGWTRDGVEYIDTTDNHWILADYGQNKWEIDMTTDMHNTLALARGEGHDEGEGYDFELLDDLDDPVLAAMRRSKQLELEGKGKC
jgi:hypothetical protein